MAENCEVYSVVGVTFDNRQSVLGAFYKSFKHGKKYQARLVKEDDNQYDSNAVAVELDMGKGWFVKVGYISRDFNESIRERWDRISDVYVHSAGPSSKGTIGVTIAIVFSDGK